MKVVIAGATGWAGSALAKGVVESSDLELVGAVSRSSAGKAIGDLIDCESALVVSSKVEDALASSPDVLVEYTKPDFAKSHILAGLDAGAHVVVGTSGLTEEDFEEIDSHARKSGLGVLAVGNFALTVVLLQKFAEMAAQYIPQWEIIDYAHSDKVDAPSGTARELAYRLSKVRESKLDVSLEDMNGPRESRGVRLNGSQVHSVRLPGYVISLDTIFGMPDQKLTLKHEAGSGAEPYVDGALLAIRKVGELRGLHRGLDTVMEFS